MIKSVLAIIAKSFQSKSKHTCKGFSPLLLYSRITFVPTEQLCIIRGKKRNLRNKILSFFDHPQCHHRTKNKNKWENLFTSSNIVPVLVTLTKKSNLKKAWKNLDQLSRHRYCLLRNYSRSMYNCNNSTKRKIHHSSRL